MIKYNLKTVLLILGVIFGYCNSAKAQSIVESVTAKELNGILEKTTDVQILDVRRPTEIVTGKIPGAANIDVAEDEFWNKFKELDKDKVYYVYGNTEGKGTSAARVMKQLGFKYVYNLKGGLKEWKSNGFELE
ncbi:rhodanese-like domain-containing protein [Fulvivirgaceae bacterium BMA10]|uniref:Rhodanese-like domain-containing protein n=1 Tax=Splendidivirga corallicola TaxID=3051826 RepID=A0ABT8KJN2_9BACT|nr:rhodanese-like domain-containing protein [Fulvivirgaceae bacterium BMA10]